MKLLLIGNFLMTLNRSVTRGNLPEYISFLGGDLSSWGLMATVGTLFNIAAIVPAGIIGDAIGRIKILYTLGLLNVICAYLVAAATTWEWIFPGYIAFELQQGIFLPIAIAMISDTIADEEEVRNIKKLTRIRMLTYFELSSVVGSSIGFLITSLYFFLVGDVYTLPLLRGNMLIGFLFSIIVFVSILFFKDSGKLESMEKRPVLLQKAPSSRTNEILIISGFGVSSFLIGLGAGFFIPFSQPFWSQEFHLSPVAINIILGTSFLCVSIGTALLPTLSRMFSRTQITLLTQGLAIPLILVIAWSPLIYVVLPTFLVRSALMNVSRPVQQALLQRGIDSSFRATGQSISSLADRVGRGITPAFASLVIIELGFKISFTITAFFYLVAIVVLYLMIATFELDPKRKHAESNSKTTRTSPLIDY